jgi:hypothetical protein
VTPGLAGDEVGHIPSPLQTTWLRDGARGSDLLKGRGSHNARIRTQETTRGARDPLFDPQNGTPPKQVVKGI